MARKKAAEEEHDPNLGPAVAAVHVGGESIVDRIVPHMKKIVVVAVAITVILALYFGVRWWKHRKEAQSTHRLALALEVGTRAIKPETTPPVPDPMALPADEEPTYPTFAARAEATLAELRKVGQTRDAAALYEARLLIQADKLDQALALYRKLAGGKGSDAAIAREGIGVVLEAKAAAATDTAEQQKLLQEALTAYRAIQPDDKGPRRDYSLYHEGRLLAEMGKKDEAIAALEKAQQVTPDTPLKPLIEQELAKLGAGTGS